MATRIRLRRGLAAQWVTTNPILASGEVGFETDTRQWKVGDGSTVWTLLGYDTDPYAVKLTGAQTVAGVKTFSSAPVVPDASFAIAKTDGLQTTLDGLVSDLADKEPTIPPGTYMPTAGGTMTGALVLPGDAASALHAVPKQQLDLALASVPTTSALLAAAGDRRSIPATQSVNIIAGYSGNAIAAGSDACTILGGGWVGQVNEITSVMQLATIVGGYDNHIGGSVPANPSVICGGSHNYLSGTATHGFIAGSDNQITALGNATITGGTGNRCSSQGGVINGGFNNTISGASSSYAVIGGGIGNSATALDTVVIGGFTNVASNTGSTVLGGGENIAAGTYSTVRGYRGNAQYSRKHVHSSGMFAAPGDQQASVQVLSQLTTDATVSYMRLDGSAGNTLPLTVPVDGAMMLSILVQARRLTSESGYPSEAKGWVLEQMVTRNSTTLATGTLVSRTFGTPTWTADIFVSSNGAVFVRVTGEAAKSIRWVADVRAAEVIA